MKRKPTDLRRWLLTAALLLVGAGYVFRHSLFPTAPGPLHEAATEAPMTVTVVTAESRPIVRRIVAGGTLRPREEVLIAAEVTGVRILKVLAEVGDQVSEGQVLAVLDGQRLDLLLTQKAADLSRAEAALAQAEALLVEAETSAADADNLLKRAVKLGESGTFAVQAVEDRRTTAATALARAKAQAQAVAVSRAELQRVVAERDDLVWQHLQLEVRAQASGVVSDRTATVGQATAADGVPLFRIVKDGQVEVEALVVETAMPALCSGQPVTVTLAGEGRVLKGTVRLVAPTIDPATRMGKIWISLADSGLKTGSFASAVVETDPHQAIVLPYTAVLTGETGARVQVVKDGRVTLRPVETGLLTAVGIEITSGVVPGEAVVAMAGGFLREGSRVTPLPATEALGF